MNGRVSILAEPEILVLLPGYYCYKSQWQARLFFHLLNVLLGLLFAKSVCILRNYNTQVWICQTENVKKGEEFTIKTDTRKQPWLPYSAWSEHIFSHHNLSASSFYSDSLSQATISCIPPEQYLQTSWHQAGLSFTLLSAVWHKACNRKTTYRNYRRALYTGNCVNCFSRIVLKGESLPGSYPRTLYLQSRSFVPLLHVTSIWRYNRKPEERHR